MTELSKEFQIQELFDQEKDFKLIFLIKEPDT